MKYCKGILRFLNNWWPIGILLIPFVILPFIDLTSITKQNFDNYKEKIEFISWTFASIMSLVSFSTLFLAYIYENKLIAASKNFKSILTPYVLTTAELRSAIIDYQNSTSSSREGLIRIIFGGFIVISFFSMLIWGAALGVYTKYQFSLYIDLTAESVLVFGIYIFYIILIFILLFLSIAIKLIILNKDPLGKGYLPMSKSIFNVKFLVENKADMNEFFMKNPIRLELFKNVNKTRRSTYEVIFHLPIYIANLRYVINIYNTESENIVTFFGKTKNDIEEEEIGGKYFYVVTNNFEESLYDSLLNDSGCYGVCKIYDTNYNLITRYILSRKLNSQINLEFIFLKTLFTNISNDQDWNLIKNNENVNNFTKYQNESGRID
ncbi:hypothetical protein [Paraliobacillus sediminis]|uniref:hypothetical protein n=1 Tax=Paraliobacillus sediminis TaxID=1885916 RepID=UPI000E3E396D|nr:hypothetical protein [Paraliobacillus sediminis]